jgi:hypothetical protein
MDDSAHQLGTKPYATARQMFELGFFLIRDASATQAVSRAPLVIAIALHRSRRRGACALHFPQAVSSHTEHLMEARLGTQFLWYRRSPLHR